MLEVSFADVTVTPTFPWLIAELVVNLRRRRNLDAAIAEDDT
jgi:hypothetical protein